MPSDGGDKMLRNYEINRSGFRSLIYGILNTVSELNYNIILANITMLLSDCCLYYGKIIWEFWDRAQVCPISWLLN